jgi:hypothetical protein
MKFPATDAELVQGGYEFRFEARCTGKTCSALLRWYHTPNGKRMPFSMVAGSEGALWEAHWASCPDVLQFRRKP